MHSSLVAAALLCATEHGAACALKDGVSRSVLRILDGETLLIDGGAEVRLIGALAPRAADAAAPAEDVPADGWPLAGKAKSSLEDLVQGRSIELGFAERRSDRYGRLLAHVFVRDGGEQKWVQGEMLRRGLARAYGLEGSTACLAELIAHERVARETATGLWAEAAYVVRGAEDVDTLMMLRGTFQVVEGKVRAVSDVRGTTYINFGEDFRQDFTVMLQTRARRTLVTAGLDTKALDQRRIRVRGWIERRGGPLIAIHHASEIEVLADVAEPPEMPDPPQRRARSRRPRASSE